MRYILALVILAGVTSSARAQPVYYETQCESIGRTLSCTVRRVERAPVDPDRFAMDFDHDNAIDKQCYREHPDPKPNPEHRGDWSDDPDYQRIMSEFRRIDAITNTCTPWHDGCAAAYAKLDKIKSTIGYKISQATDKHDKEYLRLAEEAKSQRNTCIAEAVEKARIKREREANIAKELARQEPIIARRDRDYRKALRMVKRCDTSVRPPSSDCAMAQQTVDRKRSELRTKITAAIVAQGDKASAQSATADDAAMKTR